MKPQTMQEKLEKRYAKTRIQAGLSVGQACKQLGIERELLEKIEDGRHSPNMSIVLKMAEIYGVTLGWLTLQDNPDIYIHPRMIEFLDKLTTEDQLKMLDFIESQGGWGQAE